MKSTIWSFLRIYISKPNVNQNQNVNFGNNDILNIIAMQNKDKVIINFAIEFGSSLCDFGEKI